MFNLKEIIKAVFVSLLIMLIPLYLSGCTSPFTKEKPASGKAVVVLFDLSESTANLQNLYLESFKEIIGKINHGDFLMGTKITASSVTEPEVPIKEEFPEFVPTDAQGNPTDNSLLIKDAQEKADAQLKAKKAELVKKVEGVFAAKEKKIMKTDLMSSLALAQNAFQSYRRGKAILVIFSDMIEDSGRYNFYQENLTDQRIEAIIEAEKTRGRLPDLQGVKVYIVAASDENSSKFFEVQKFWLKYFSACGANLTKENYSNTLLKFE